MLHHYEPGELWGKRKKDSGMLCDSVSNEMVEEWIEYYFE